MSAGVVYAETRESIVLLLYSIAAGLVIGRLLGGRVRNIERVQFVWWQLALGGLLVQLVLFADPVQARVGEAGVPVYVISTLAVLVALSGALFSTALGLFFGTVFEVKQQMTIWAFSALTALLIPVFMAGMSELLPNSLTRVVHWIPSATMSYLFQLSCVADISPGSFLPELGVVIGSGVLGLAVVIWLVRRSDR